MSGQSPSNVVSNFTQAVSSIAGSSNVEQGT
jgi:hypothetical protein